MIRAGDVATLSKHALAAEAGDAHAALRALALRPADKEVQHRQHGHGPQQLERRLEVAEDEEEHEEVVDGEAVLDGVRGKEVEGRRVAWLGLGLGLGLGIGLGLGLLS